MLYKNHKKVVLKDEDIYKRHKDEFESFIKGKKTILFKTHDQIKFNKTGVMEPARTQTVPVEVVVSDGAGGDDSWIYLEKAPKVLQNGENDYDRVKTPIFVSRTLSVPTTKPDLIFFLMYMSSAAKTGRLFAFNEEAEDEKKLIELSKSSNVDFFLTSSYSPLTEDNMRRIAKSFGIEDVDKMTKAKLVLTLKSEVDKAERSGDTSRNVNAFITAMEQDDVTSTKSIVQEAIDAKRITYDEMEGAWFFTDEIGARIRKIVTVDMMARSSKYKRELTLHNVYLSSETKRKELFSLMGYTTDEVDFNNYQYPSLKAFAKQQCGLEAKGTKEELVERITKFVDENKTNKKFDYACLVLEKQTTE